VHRGRHGNGDRADLGQPVEQLRHVLLVGVEDGLIEVAVGPVVHAQQDRHVAGLVDGHVAVEPGQGVGRPVAADAGVVEMDPQFRASRVVEILDVLGIQTLMGDAVAEEHEAVAVLEHDGREHLLEGAVGLGGRGLRLGRNRQRLRCDDNGTQQDDFPNAASHGGLPETKLQIRWGYRREDPLRGTSAPS